MDRVLDDKISQNHVNNNNKKNNGLMNSNNKKINNIINNKNNNNNNNNKEGTRLLSQKVRRKPRVVFSGEQTTVLERKYQQQKYLNPCDRQLLAAELKLQQQQVSIIFSFF